MLLPSHGNLHASSLGPRMGEEQHLYWEPGYRLNSEIEAIREKIREDWEWQKKGGEPLFENVYLVPAILDRERRGFRWLTIKNNNWSWNIELLEGVKAALDLLFERWEDEKPRLHKEWHEQLSESELDELAEKWNKIRSSQTIEELGNESEASELHRALMKLVTARLVGEPRLTQADGATPRENDLRYIEGLVLRQASAQRAKGRLLFVNSLLRESGAEVPSACRTRAIPPTRFHSYLLNKDGYGWHDGQDGWFCQTCGWMTGDHEERVHEEEPPWVLKLQDAILNFGAESHLAQMVSVPIYDGGSIHKPWGRLVGIVHANVYGKAKPAKAIWEAIAKHGDRLSAAFRAVARAQVAGTAVGRETSPAGLAAQHFLEILPSFQDWEWVKVFRADAGKIETWGRTGGRWGVCVDAGDARSREAQSLKLQNLDVLLALPWASERDIQELRCLELEFHLPFYALTPEGSEWKRLERQYKHELLDVLRLVLTKVQRHRYAVRTAAVAIMSRNMSHNLGSHVLSAVVSEGTRTKDLTEDQATKVTQALENAPSIPSQASSACKALANEDCDQIKKAVSAWPQVREERERRDGLLGYLQERMDFLAEVSTSSSFMPVSMRIEEVVSPFLQEYLLTKYISGTKHHETPVGVSVAVRSGGQTVTAVPGGRNGCHALYVIIENIARNCAKHCSHQSNGRDVHIGLQAQLVGDLIRIRIWDNGRNANVSQGMLTPVEQLGAIIENDSIIDSDGVLRPGGWGIREIMIAAAYLRGLPIEDSERVQIPKLLKVLPVDRKTGSDSDAADACIGYEFYLKTPKDLLVIYPSLRDIPDDRISLLNTWGIGLAPTRDAVGGDKSDYRYIAAGDGGSQVEAVDGEDWPHRIVPLASVEQLLFAADEPDQIRRAIAVAWQSKLLNRHAIDNVTVCGNRKMLATPDWKTVPAATSVAYVHHHQELNKNTRSKIQDMLFWESYSPQDDQLSLIESSPEDQWPLLRIEFTTAALARIVVLDERVQEAVQQYHRTEWDGLLTMVQALERRRVFVPTEFSLKDVPQWSKISSWLAKLRIDGLENVPGGPIDFVVVHLGILERMVGSDGQKLGWKQALDALLTWVEQNDPGCEIVLCSGRGIPKEVGESGLRFVPVSALERWSVHKASKYHLYEMLASSRRRAG